MSFFYWYWLVSLVLLWGSVIYSMHKPVETRYKHDTFELLVTVGILLTAAFTGQPWWVIAVLGVCVWFNMLSRSSTYDELVASRAAESKTSLQK